MVYECLCLEYLIAGRAADSDIGDMFVREVPYLDLELLASAA